MNFRSWNLALSEGFGYSSPTEVQKSVIKLHLTELFEVQDLEFVGYGFHTVVFGAKDTAYAATRWVDGYHNARKAADLFPKHNPPSIYEIAPVGDYWAVSMDLIDGTALLDLDTENTEAKATTTTTTTVKTKATETKTVLSELAKLAMNPTPATNTNTNNLGSGDGGKFASISDALIYDTNWSCECDQHICSKLKPTPALQEASNLVTEYDFSWAENTRSWIHGDMHLANVIRTNSKLHVIDWSHMSLMPALFELVPILRQSRWISGIDPRFINHGKLAIQTIELAMPLVLEKYDHDKAIELLNVACVANLLGEYSQEAHKGMATSERAILGLELAMEAYEVNKTVAEVAKTKASEA